MATITLNTAALKSARAQAVAAGIGRPRYVSVRKQARRLAQSARAFTPKTVALRRPDVLARPSSTRRHEMSYAGERVYISNPLTVGNSKLSKNCLIFDTLAVYTCGNCSQCAARCYAVKAQRQYAGTWDKRACHTYLAAHDLPRLRALLIGQLAGTDKPYCRIHSSGEFFSQAYVDMWADIVRMFPAVRFYFYTKMAGLLDFSALICAPNCNMVRSVLPDGSVNFGSYEYVHEKAARFGIPVCPYGAEKAKAKHEAGILGRLKGLIGRALSRFINRSVKDIKNAPVHCGSDCTICMHSPYVLFYEH